MAILHVRGVPDALYDQLRTRAGSERRSLSGEVIHLLEQALNMTAPEIEDPVYAEYARRARVLREDAAAWYQAHGPMQTRENHRAAWAEIDAFREALATQYGMLADSTSVIRTDRERDELRR